MLKTESKSQRWLEKNFDFKNTYGDSVAMQLALTSLVRELRSNSYLEASLDSLYRQDSLNFRGFLHIGKTYDWLYLRANDILDSWLRRSGYKARLYEGRPFSFPTFYRLREKLLRQAENNGYPFAQVQLKEIEIRDNEVSATLDLKRDSLILTEKIKVNGDVKISNLYLENYLDIHPGLHYNGRKVRAVKDRLNELIFLGITKDPTVTFVENRAVINLFLEERRSSRFDFIIGVLPNSQVGGRLIITGDFKGELQNQFGQGERIYAAFEQLRPQTQKLDLQFNYPFVAKLPFGIDFKFDLYKQDTTFLDLEYDFGIQYLFEAGNYIKAFWRNQASNLLTIDTQAIAEQQTLPASLDYGIASFGLAYQQQKLDYRFNPRSGWSVFLRGDAGFKKIRRNNKIESLAVEGLYDTIPERIFQYQLDAVLAAYLPVFDNSTIKFGLSGGGIFSDNPIYRNEQYRIGGNRLLRGFDEASIFVTRYLLFTTEYRLLIGQNSYLYTFGDFAYVQDLTPTTRTDDRPLGFGVGITFETKVGLFGFSLAYGKQKQNALNLDTPKIHFGYVSLF